MNIHAVEYLGGEDFHDVDFWDDTQRWSLIKSCRFYPRRGRAKEISPSQSAGMCRKNGAVVCCCKRLQVRESSSPESVRDLKSMEDLRALLYVAHPDISNDIMISLKDGLSVLVAYHDSDPRLYLKSVGRF